jgi:chromosome segregation ATPase
MPGESLFQTLQKIATALHRLDVQAEEIRELRAVVTSGFDKLQGQTARLEGQIADLRERLARLEASREADRSQAQADLARFKLEVERAQIQLSRQPSLQAEPPTRPEGSEEGT